MSAAAATKTAYQPRILTPTMKRPQPGLTVYLVESHTANEFYFVWVQPGGSIRCQCKAAKFGNECCHKKALQAHLEQVVERELQRVEVIPWKVRQVQRREAALPAWATDNTPFSIFKSEDHDGNYIPGDYYQHAYR